MKHIPVLIISFLIILSGVVIGQEENSVSESRKKNLRSVLDYRYKGGYYSFEQLFYQTVQYPDIAIHSCALGIVIARFEVDCEGELVKLTMKNMLRYGLDEEISKFFNSTVGQWNKCDDDKYTKFEIPIQFTLDGTKTNTTDALLIVEGETIGFDCRDDEYYLEKAEKYLEKKNGKKALQNINMLIQRNPLESRYFDMKKQAIELINK